MLRLAACVVVALGLGGCEKPPPSSGFKMYGDGSVPDKPGASIDKQLLCTCIACQPNDCCRELEQEQPEIDKDCADGYDFSKCEMAVSSCETSCFKERWRTDTDRGCDASRPDVCCHEQPAF